MFSPQARGWTEIAEWQRSGWLGGKKNDIVLCYGCLGTNNISTWATCFGWSESEICKRNIESILLTNPINNSILPIIEKEIIQNYVIKNWTKLDYITIDPPKWSFYVLLSVMLITQVIFWIWSSRNEFDK